MTYVLLRMGWQLNRRKVKGWWKRIKDHLPVKRHPKSPKDCPHCCRGVQLERVRINHAVTSWSEVKSQRGRKKQYPTQGWACLNPGCPYFGITKEAIQALVRHTLRGQDRDILYLRCQCCRTVFSSRKGYYLKTKTDRVERVLWFLAEGVNRAVLVRYTGHQDATLARWLERMGEHSQGLHTRLFRGLVVSLVQLDELYAQVKDSEPARWLWLVMDPVTKVIPTRHLGDGSVKMLTPWRTT
jgi:transposase-like protein